ncbi:MAG: hypothetical protein IBJ12_11755 [Sphingomonadaceae bacterium]|nr:hypothetical protein [Sphingomonadaceae bacterium]
MRLSLGITGHRDSNPVYRGNAVEIEAQLRCIFDAVDRDTPADAKPRLHALLSLGADLQAVEMALALGWQVSAPLPFGKRLNVAINAQARSVEDARALLYGEGQCSAAIGVAAARIADATLRVTCFELAERDSLIESLLLETVRNPLDSEASSAFSVAASERAALAGQVMVEQIDMLIAVWDGQSPGPVGGTRHTIARALEIGIPVLWLDAGNPGHWRILDNPESLANRRNANVANLAEVVAMCSAIVPVSRSTEIGRDLLDNGPPPTRSRRRFHIYRRIEVLFAGEVGRFFGSLTQHYAREDDVVAIEAAELLRSASALPQSDESFLEKTEKDIIRRFARADAVATYLSDAYRGGMVANLLLAAFAVIGGIAYLPFFDAGAKWPFALFEFALLVLILSIIVVGRRRDWHGRWFQTRRVAEYLRHAPFMLLLGVARPAGSWPHSNDAGWPEHYVRSILREIGLPDATICQQTLRTALDQWIGRHVSAQRAYHAAKAKRLERIHDNLEKVSEKLFLLAMLVVAAYLLGEVAGWIGLIPVEDIRHASKLFTFLGVALPTLGGALAGIHYFADFGRFAAISESTAHRLGGVEQRIAALLAAPDAELDYGRVAGIARAVDEIVVAEIEHWQDVFGGKHISVPV